MLMLKRITRFNEFLKCKASGKIMMYGDFYYEDDETGDVIDAKYYHNQMMEKRKEEFDNSILERAQSQKEYQDELKKAEQEYLTATMLSKYVVGHEADNYEKEKLQNG